MYRRDAQAALGKSGLHRLRCEDFVEGKILGGTAGALLPGEEQAAIAIGQACGGIDIESGQGVVNPGGRSFEFRIIADGRFVDHEVALRIGESDFVGMNRVGKERAVDRGCDVRPLGAKLLVTKDRRVSHLFKDGAERGTVVDSGLGLDADFVANGVAFSEETFGRRLWVTVQRLP